MNWNYVATFTGTGPIAYLPAGAVDESDTLWVMWADADHDEKLTYFSHPVHQEGTFTIKPQPLGPATAGSPCLMCVQRQLVTLFLDPTHGGALSWGVLDPKTGFKIKAVVANHPAPTGPLAAFFPVPDCLFIAYTERNEISQLYLSLFYSDLIGLRKGAPQTTSPKPFPTRKVPPEFKTEYSPAVVAMPADRNGVQGIGVLWKGPGAPYHVEPNIPDNSLYFMTASDPLNPVFPATNALQYPEPGGKPNPVTNKVPDVEAWSMGRPSLALHVGKSATTLVALYPGARSLPEGGKLRFLVGTLNGDGDVTWAAPPQNGTTDGTVPLRALLKYAGVGGGAVKLDNPVGVWVTAPSSSNDLYLLVGDEWGGRIAGPLYLIRYSGASS